MAKTARQPTVQQILINKFITVEFSVDKYFWPRETKIVNGLIKIYSQEFLAWLKPPYGYKVNSMVYFLGKEGQDYIASQMLEYRKVTTDYSPNPLDVPLSEHKIGDDAPLVNKPKTLKDFLNLNNK